MTQCDMPKLIHSHTECGYKVVGLCLYHAQHSIKLLTAKAYCNPIGEENFPACCPLEEGISLPKSNRRKRNV